MRSSPRPTVPRTVVALTCLLSLLASLPAPAVASAYNGHPKLIVVIVIDQFRGDYLERYRDQFGDGGFRLFLDHGAYFPDCSYNYANTNPNIRIQLADGGRQLATAYPAQLPTLKAGEWNLSAARNNRVEFKATSQL